jgi:hypothetical protein
MHLVLIEYLSHIIVVDVQHELEEMIEQEDSLMVVAEGSCRNFVLLIIEVMKHRVVNVLH